MVDSIHPHFKSSAILWNLLPQKCQHPALLSLPWRPEYCFLNHCPMSHRDAQWPFVIKRSCYSHPIPSQQSDQSLTQQNAAPALKDVIMWQDYFKAMVVKCKNSCVLDLMLSLMANWCKTTVTNNSNYSVRLWLSRGEITGKIGLLYWFEK